MAGANESDEVSETVRNARNSRTWGTSENLILFMALPYRCHLFRIPFPALNIFFLSLSLLLWFGAASPRERILGERSSGEIVCMLRLRNSFENQSGNHLSEGWSGIRRFCR
ncbi:hypothetical protein CDAR_169491 [Caerostris darwini]|uniref:Uncharacterized protein n=1 Tax=Caerostris darwini TaxID=1538125 RepID=A0AAV4T1F9_9ARAC|nr:hypothetical protein CDAR_169491 [Caerostris darwini]